MQFIEIKDYILSPIYFFIIYLIAYNKRNSKYSVKNTIHKYYIPALTVKLVGAVALGLIYQYYYGGGDTAQYFYNSKLIAEYFSKDTSSFIDLVFKPVFSTLDLRRQIPWGDTTFAYSETNYFPIRIMALIQLISGFSYLPSALILSAISFTGIWKAYTAFVHIFPNLHKQFAIAFFFIPSVFFWGSGILKDTMTLAALCWLFYASYRLFILRVKIINSIIVLIISTFVMISIKPYIPLVFLPSLLFWIFFQYRNSIRSYYLRVMVVPFMLFFIVVGAYYIVNVIGQTDKHLQIENLTNSAANLNSKLRAEDGASFDIGVTETSTPLQILKIAPLAIITTLFRPFLWEVSSPIMALSSLEGLFVLYVFYLIISKVGFIGIIKVIKNIPLVTFCLVFGFAFSFAVGFSTSNFGALVRYKIPAMPFLIAGLFIILDKGQKKAKEFTFRPRPQTIKPD